MDYRELYRNLAQELSNLNCAVYDPNHWGHSFRAKRNVDFIVIRNDLTYKEKFFVLAHEAGHLFYMKKGNMFNRSRKIRTEDQANWFALRLLKFYKIDRIEYFIVFNKAKISEKKRKKTWFEL